MNLLPIEAQGVETQGQLVQPARLGGVGLRNSQGVGTPFGIAGGTKLTSAVMPEGRVQNEEFCCCDGV